MIARKRMFAPLMAAAFLGMFTCSLFGIERPVGLKRARGAVAGIVKASRGTVGVAVRAHRVRRRVRGQRGRLLSLGERGQAAHPDRGHGRDRGRPLRPRRRVEPRTRGPVLRREPSFRPQGAGHQAVRGEPHQHDDVAERQYGHRRPPEEGRDRRRQRPDEVLRDRGYPGRPDDPRTSPRLFHRRFEEIRVDAQGRVQPPLRANGG